MRAQSEVDGGMASHVRNGRSQDLTDSPGEQRMWVLALSRTLEGCVVRACCRSHGRNLVVSWHLSPETHAMGKIRGKIWGKNLQKYS